MVCSLMVMTASSSVWLPSISLACPGLARMSAFSTAPGLRSDRSAIVLSSSRMSRSSAGPSVVVNAITAWSGSIYRGDAAAGAGLGQAQLSNASAVIAVWAHA